MREFKDLKIAVAGTGYVGLSIATLLAQHHKIVSVDIIPNKVEILLVNNNGGIEFKLQNKDNKSIDRYIAASGHFQDARGWAETCGFKYFCAKTKNEFDSLLQTFIQKSDKPILLEMFVSDSDEAIAYKTIVEQNTLREPKDILKSSLKTIAKKILR